MTATPRIYADTAKMKVDEANAYFLVIIAYA